MRPDPTPRRGAAGMLFLFSVVIAGAGLAFDLMLNQGAAFWIGAQPGARSIIGAAAALFVIAAAHLVRAALGQRDAPAPKKGVRRAGDHS